ncbi:hypothetical protein K1X76_12640, partial [bacterium]|nr:hypothetical protein [bacterium]
MPLPLPLEEDDGFCDSTLGSMVCATNGFYDGEEVCATNGFYDGEEVGDYKGIAVNQGETVTIWRLSEDRGGIKIEASRGYYPSEPIKYFVTYSDSASISKERFFYIGYPNLVSRLIRYIDALGFHLSPDAEGFPRYIAQCDTYNVQIQIDGLFIKSLLKEVTSLEEGIKSFTEEVRRQAIKSNYIGGNGEYVLELEWARKIARLRAVAFSRSSASRSSASRSSAVGGAVGSVFGIADVLMDNAGVPAEWQAGVLGTVGGGMVVAGAATAPVDLLAMPVAIPAHAVGESVGEWVGETQVVQGVEETVGFDLTTDQWGTLGGSTAGGIA